MPGRAAKSAAGLHFRGCKSRKEKFIVELLERFSLNRMLMKNGVSKQSKWFVKHYFNMMIIWF